MGLRQEALSLEFSDLIVVMAIKFLRHLESSSASQLRAVLSPAHYNREIGSLYIRAARGMGHTTALSKLIDLLGKDYRLIVVIPHPPHKKMHMRPACDSNVKVLFPDSREFEGLDVDDRTIILLDNWSMFEQQMIDDMMDWLFPKAFILLG